MDRVEGLITGLNRWKVERPTAGLNRERVEGLITGLKMKSLFTGLCRNWSLCTRLHENIVIASFSGCIISFSICIAGELSLRKVGRSGCNGC